MSASTTAGPGVSRSRSASTLKSLRKLHLYFGLFIAPALLFFAFTGAMQTLSLHEAAGDSYHPPKWLERLGNLHKDQTIQVREHKAPPASAAPRPGTAAGAAPGTPHAAAPAQPARPPVTLASKETQHLPMKIFFLCVALGLFSSTLTGIYLAYKYERSAGLVTGILLAGLVIPLILLRF